MTMNMFRQALEIFVDGDIHKDVPTLQASQKVRSQDVSGGGLARIRSTPFMHRLVTRIDGRTIQANGSTIVDFAHCGYLGVDHDLSLEDVATAKYWGLRNGWSRITGSTSLSRGLEVELEARLGFPHARLGQSISLINLTVFSALAKRFPNFLLERDIHITLRNGISAGIDRNSHQIMNWSMSDLGTLKNHLDALPYNEPKLITIDGIYSMKGVSAPIEELLSLCTTYNAVLYIDDAHGFGVEGHNGYGVIEGKKSFDPSRVIYVGSFSKCTSNPVAFICFDSSLQDLIDGFAHFLSFCGPPSNIHIATSLRHLKNFPKADFQAKRKRLTSLSEAVYDGCSAKGIPVLSSRGSPIVSMRINPDMMEEVVQHFYSGGVLGKPAIFPVVRRGDELIRFTVSAAHTDENINRLISISSLASLGLETL